MSDVVRRLAAELKIPLEGEAMLTDLVNVIKELAQRALSSDAAQEIRTLLDDVLNRHAPAAAEEPADPAAPAAPVQ